MNATTHSASSGRVSLTEKVGYALGDTASNLIFQILINLAPFYYAKTVGLDPAVTGTLFLIVRAIDAITDPVMGVIADRTRTRMGRYRPWLLWLAVPFGVAGVLTFSVPESTAAVETAYVFATYVLMTLIYTAINIPYCALISSMTDDTVERQKIQSWRFVGGQAGGLIIGAVTLPLVEWFGGGAQGWTKTLIVFGVIAVAMFLACFLSTAERIATEPNEGSMGAGGDGSIMRDAKRLWQNDQWRILCTIKFVLLIAVVMRLQAVPFLIEDNFGLKGANGSAMIAAYFTLGAIASVSGSFLAGIFPSPLSLKALFPTVAAQIGLSAALVAAGIVPADLAIQCSIAVGLTSVACVALSRFLKRVPLLVAILSLQVLAHLALFWIGASSFANSAIAAVVVSCLTQAAVPVIWAMMADSVDYGEVRTGRRLPALTFSTVLFSLKMGIAVAGALGGWLLAGFGYQATGEGVADITQSAAALSGILLCYTLIPAGFMVVVVLVVSRLKLTEAAMDGVRATLAQR